MVETIEPGSVVLESYQQVQEALKERLHSSVDPEILDDLRKPEQNFLIGLSHSNYEHYQHAAHNNLDGNGGKNVRSGLALILGNALSGKPEVSDLAIPPVFDEEGNIEPFYDNANEMVTRVARQKKIVVYDTRLETVESILDTEGVFAIDPKYIKQPEFTHLPDILVQYAKSFEEKDARDGLMDELGDIGVMEHFMALKDDLELAEYQGDLLDTIKNLALDAIGYVHDSLKESNNDEILDCVGLSLQALSKYEPRLVEQILDKHRQDQEGLQILHDDGILDLYNISSEGIEYLREQLPL